MKIRYYAGFAHSTPDREPMDMQGKCAGAYGMLGVLSSQGTPATCPGPGRPFCVLTGSFGRKVPEPQNFTLIKDYDFFPHKLPADKDFKGTP